MSPISENTRQVVEPLDPRDRFAKPPFPQEKQSASGSSNELSPPADYGEESCQGHNRLLGRSALVAGGDSGIGRGVALCPMMRATSRVKFMALLAAKCLSKQRLDR